MGITRDGILDGGWRWECLNGMADLPGWPATSNQSSQVAQSSLGRTRSSRVSRPKTSASENIFEKSDRAERATGALIEAYPGVLTCIVTQDSYKSDTKRKQTLRQCEASGGYVGGSQCLNKLNPVLDSSMSMESGISVAWIASLPASPRNAGCLGNCLPKRSTVDLVTG